MLKGYNGKILRLDLSNGDTDFQQINEPTARKYIGGVGLAAKILWDETTPDTTPFSPENELVFMTGPLTGSSLPKSSRYIVAGISPLTGIWGEANSGGYFGPALRFAGWDGIVIRGQSEQPVMLVIEDDKVKLDDAADLWGKDTYETTDAIAVRFQGKPQLIHLAELDIQLMGKTLESAWGVETESSL